MIEIEIPGVPIPLARARAGKHGFYDSQYMVKKNIRDYVNAEYGTLPCAGGPISVEMIFYMPIPKSTSQKRRIAMLGQPHIKAGDLTNFFKLPEDTFNGVLWVDDRIISELHAKKIYDENPRTIIRITEL